MDRGDLLMGSWCAGSARFRLVEAAEFERELHSDSLAGLSGALPELLQVSDWLLPHLAGPEAGLLPRLHFL